MISLIFDAVFQKRTARYVRKGFSLALLLFAFLYGAENLTGSEIIGIADYLHQFLSPRVIYLMIAAMVSAIVGLHYIEARDSGSQPDWAAGLFLSKNERTRFHFEEQPKQDSTDQDSTPKE